MKRTCNNCYAFDFYHNDKRTNKEQPALIAYCNLGYEVETTKNVKVKDLHYGWFGKPLEECPKPTTIITFIKLKAKKNGIKI